MRVTFLTQWFDPEPGNGGLPFAREIMRRGFEMEIVTGFPNYPTGNLYPGYKVRPWQREMMDGVSVLRVPLYPSHDSNALRRAANYASFSLSSSTIGTALARPSDLLYVYHPPPTIGMAAAVFRRVRRVPVVYHIADMWPESAVESGMLGSGRTKQAAQSLLEPYCRWVYSKCDAFTVISPGFAQLLCERGVPRERIHVVYNWADDDLFRPMPRDENLAHELGLSGLFNVIYAGNMGAFQGLESVVQAALQLRDRPNVQIVFAGTGVEEARLRAFARSLGVSNVRFLGHRSIQQMPAINALADVLLVHLRDLPFFRITIPGKTLVALASGRPIIMGVAGDAADVVRWASAGIAVPPEAPDALAAAIRDMHSMPSERREEMGRRGREYYVREMSLEAGVSKTAEIFRDVGDRSLRARGSASAA